MRTSLPLVRQFALGLAMVLPACWIDHGAGDADETCPPILDDSCLNPDCCADIVSGDYNLRTCELECPAGYIQSTSVRACDPSCGVAIDAGPSPMDASPGDDAAVAPNACADDAECALVFPGCCGPCGTPELEAYIAMNEAFVAEYRAATCPDDGPICVPCPERYAPNPAHVAMCVGGQCVPVDLSAGDVASCTRDDECDAVATGCCACGGELIGVRREESARLTEFFCPDANVVDCPECEIATPVAWCEGGRCQADWAFLVED